MNMKRNKWRMILDIARTELQTLFYSPIAWLTLIIFVVQASMTFSSVFGTYVERFNLGYRPVNLTHFLWFQRIVLLNITLFVLLLPASHDGINESGIE